MWSNPNYPGMKTLHKKQGGRGPPRAQRLNLPLPSGRKAVWWSDLRLSPNIPSPSQESPCSNPPFVCPPSFSRRHSHPLPSPPTPPRLQTPPLKILPSFAPTSVLVWREETHGINHCNADPGACNCTFAPAVDCRARYRCTRGRGGVLFPLLPGHLTGPLGL